MISNSSGRDASARASSFARGRLVVSRPFSKLLAGGIYRAAHLRVCLLTAHAQHRQGKITPLPCLQAAPHNCYIPLGVANVLSQRASFNCVCGRSNNSLLMIWCLHALNWSMPRQQQVLESTN